MTVEDLEPLNWPLNWIHRVQDIGDERAFERTATAQECEALSRAFGDAKCRSLSAAYAVRAIGPGRYRVSGTIMARLELVCGVTLDPVDQIIDEPFTVEFCKDASPAEQLSSEFDALDEDDPEPLRHGAIAIGRYIAEQIASLIDPFPRSADAELERSEAGGGDVKEEKENPFAILERLKRDAGSSTP